MLFSTVLRLTMVASVIYCAVKDLPNYGWIPVLSLFVFAVRGVAAADGDAVRIDVHAEQTYYFGFLGTLSTLPGFLARLYLNGKETLDLHSLAMIGMVGSLGMLAGFFGLITLKEYAQRLADEGSPAPSLQPAVPTARAGETAASSVPAEPVPVSTDAAELAEINRKLLDMIARILKFIEGLPASLEKAKEAFVASGERAHEIADVVKNDVTEIKNDVTEMQSLLDELELLKRRVLDQEAA
jgi:hypothetical protein